MSCDYDKTASFILVAVVAIMVSSFIIGDASNDWKLLGAINWCQSITAFLVGTVVGATFRLKTFRCVIASVLAFMADAIRPRED